MQPAERRLEPAWAEHAVLLLGLGDTHGDFAPLFTAAEREPRAQAILQVGDLTAGKAGREQRADDDPATLAQLPAPLVWVHGNHEHWAQLGLDETADHGPQTARGRSRAAAQRGDTAARGPGIHLWPGTSYVVPETQIRVVGLPGNYAPTWYERQKPFPGDRVRHFNLDDVNAVLRFQHPAVLLMHEAFRGQLEGRIGMLGVAVLSRLVRLVQPEIVLTGHHHLFAVKEHGPTLAIALPRAQEGYARLYFTLGGQRLGWEFVPFEQTVDSPP